MSKVKEIISGWKNYVFPSEEVERIAIHRMETCLDCPKLKDNKRCSLCGCFMPAKVRSIMSTCPLKKW
jgi:hypothetical protein